MMSAGENPGGRAGTKPKLRCARPKPTEPPERPLDLTCYELKSYKVMAMEYTGCNMDAELVRRFPLDFCMGYSYGQQSLMPRSRNMQMPMTGHILVFLAASGGLLDIMAPSKFKNTYKEHKN